MTETASRPGSYRNAICFDPWNIRILNLSFDFAQDGEPFGLELMAEVPVEPFRASIFGFRIFRRRLNGGHGNAFSSLTAKGLGLLEKLG